MLLKKILLSAGISVTSLCSAQSTGRSAESILQHFLHPSGDYVLVAAHRGDWHDAPENSLNALKYAIAIGVDITETDVRKTKDGVLVLMHDETINRTSGGKGRVDSYTWDSLKTVILRKENGIPTNQHIPSFEEFMTAVKGKPILINLDKCWGYLPEVYAVLKKTGTVEQGLFKGPYSLTELRKRYGTLIDSIHYIPMTPVTDNAANNPSDGIRNFTLDYLDHYKPAGFELNIASTQSPVYTTALPMIKKAGITVFINTLWGSLCADHEDEKALDDPDANWGWVIRQGANVIQTDQPVQLLDYLRKNKLHD